MWVIQIQKGIRGYFNSSLDNGQAAADAKENKGSAKLETWHRAHWQSAGVIQDNTSQHHVNTAQPIQEAFFFYSHILL